MFGESKNAAFTARDIRFTAKQGVLYAIALGWPTNGELTITSLGQDSALAPGSIESVALVASNEQLNFRRTRSGLTVRLPDGLAGSFAVAMKVRGPGLA
jgi:alpha-L-fucosidase